MPYFMTSPTSNTAARSSSFISTRPEILDSYFALRFSGDHCSHRKILFGMNDCQSKCPEQRTTGPQSPRDEAAPAAGE